MEAANVGTKPVSLDADVLAHEDADIRRWFLAEGGTLPRWLLWDYNQSDDDIQAFMVNCGFRRAANDRAWCEEVLRKTEARETARKAGVREKTFYSLDPRPFNWIDPASIPKRQWLYGTHYARRFVSTTVAPGGVGKSSLAKVEALAMATGRPLLGITPPSKLGVWYFNLEDPIEELQRRMMANTLYYGISEAELADANLYINSGRDKELVIAEQTKNQTTIIKPTVDELKRAIEYCDIDLLIVDPFVSSHRLPENDNNAIDIAVKQWASIADATNCAIELVHHVRKTNGAEVTVEDGRGASALLAAARSARVLNSMSADEAERAGVTCRHTHFRVDNGKANMAPPAEGSTWYRMASQRLPNGTGGMIDDGDDVGVCTPWAWPAALDGFTVDDLRQAQTAVAKGSFRENVQAKDWAGHAIGTALGLDTRGSKADRHKVKAALRVWMDNGMFVIVMRNDASGQQRPFLEVGERADD